jgi:hypothetical protein
VPGRIKLRKSLGPIVHHILPKPALRVFAVLNVNNVAEHTATSVPFLSRTRSSETQDPSSSIPTPMSLSALPTELDEMIIQQLSQRALHNLTLTSKYYRSLVEPYPYRNIKLYESDPRYVKRLLLSIINRRDLSRHIQSLELVSKNDMFVKYNASSTSTDEENSKRKFESHCDRLDNFNEDLLKRSIEIKKLIIEFTEPFFNYKHTLNWYLDVTGAFQSVDGSLALILCLATNLEHLQLSDVGARFTNNVCRLRWEKYHKDASQGVWPLHKLKDLELALRRRTSFPMPPHVETLKVDGLSHSNISWWLWSEPGIEGGFT